MAFGFSPKYEQEISITGLDHIRAYVQAVETAKELGWSAGFYSETGFVAYTGFSALSWGEEIRVIFSNDTIRLKSECTGAQIYDWGKNKNNVRQFISKFQNCQN